MRMHTRTIALTLLMWASTAAAHDPAMVAARSPWGAVETMDRFQRQAEAAGLKVFTRIDHAEGAASVGMSLRPTQVLVFGNPKGGTPLMECAQTLGIDLPLKALAWEDAGGVAWLGYNDPKVLAERHGAQPCKAAGSVSDALATLVAKTLATTR